MEEDNIGRVSIRITPAETIRARSVCHVMDPRLFAGELPAVNGPLDPRLGPLDHRLRCGTCHLSVHDCKAGHVGHIELPHPTLHPMYAYDLVPWTLQCVCFFCSALVLQEAELAMAGDLVGRACLDVLRKRAGKNSELDKHATTYYPCPVCHAPQPAYYASDHRIRASWRRADLAALPAELRALCVTTLEFDDEKPVIADTKRFSNYDVLRILRGIQPPAAHALGYRYTHPADLVIRPWTVMPATIRPCLGGGGSGRGRSSGTITTQINEILDLCMRMRITIQGLLDCDEVDNEFNPFPQEVVPHKVRIFADVLFSMLSEFIFRVEPHGSAGADSADTKERRQVLKLVRHRGTPGDPLLQQIKGKDGLIRGHTSGKRVNFSARACIAPEATIRPTQVGVPTAICLELTYPHRATRHNLAQLRALVIAGPEELDGANAVLLGAQRVKVDLHITPERRAKLAATLAIGDVVEVHLRNGDLVLLNRQPTLHTGSMLAFETVRVKGDTLQIHHSVCKTFNADFDGDEMNLHLPQDEEARAELLTICSIEANFFNPSRSVPMLCMQQDPLIGAFCLTAADTLLAWPEVCRLLMACEFRHKCACRVPSRACPHHLEDPATPDPLLIGPPALLRPQRLWTGAQVFSYLLSQHLTLDTAPLGGGGAGKRGGKGGESVLIVRGQLVRGQLTKREMSNGAGMILHALGRDVGPAAGIRFVNDCTRMMNAYLRVRQLSIGYDDLISSEAAFVGVRTLLANVAAKLQLARERAEQLTERLAAAGDQEFIAERDAALEQFSRTILLQVLARVAPQLEDELKTSDNRIHLLATRIGAKGNRMGVVQLMACLGQQLVDGRRLQPRGATPRLLPYFPMGDTDPRAHGFIPNSFGTGLTPSEWACHHMATREGLTDTAVRTSEVGYLSRRLVKGLESFIAGCNGVVLTNGITDDPQSRTVLTRWAGHGRDVSLLETVDHSQFLEATNAFLKTLAGSTNELRRLTYFRDTLRRWRLDTVEGRLSCALKIPIDFHRWGYRLRYVHPDPHGTVCTAAEVDAFQQAFVERLGGVHAEHIHLLASASFLWCTYRVRNIYRLTPRQMQHGFDEAMNLWERAEVPVGEAVGIKAAQAISEPCLQMTLNSVSDAKKKKHGLLFWAN